MRTSGGRGTEGWMMGLPIAAVIVASSMSAGGIDAMVMSVEGVVRQTLAAVAGFVGGLW